MNLFRKISATIGITITHSLMAVIQTVEELFVVRSNSYKYRTWSLWDNYKAFLERIWIGEIPPRDDEPEIYYLDSSGKKFQFYRDDMSTVVVNDKKFKEVEE